MAKGCASHKPECQCRFCRLRRGEKLPPVPRKAKAPVTSAVKDELSAGLPTQRDLSENTDKVLDHFEYTLNEKDVAIWSGDIAASPVNPPRALVDKYPEFEFKLASKKKLTDRGEGYGGWQVIKDSALGYADGCFRSGDSVFVVRPKTLGDKIRRAKESAAESQIHGLSENRQAEMARRASGNPDLLMASGSPVKSRMAGLGIIVGRSGARIMREQASSKKYFDLGGR